MKRKFIPHRRDRNLETAEILGAAARLNDKPASACPNLILLFDAAYAALVEAAWMRGWTAADQRLQLQSRHNMKGTD